MASVDNKLEWTLSISLFVCINCSINESVCFFLTLSRDYVVKLPSSIFSILCPYWANYTAHLVHNFSLGPVSLCNKYLAYE